MQSLDIVPKGPITISWPEDMELVMTGLGEDRVTIVVRKLQRQKPGPKAETPEVKSVKIDSSLLHKVILNYLSHCDEATSADIRQAVAKHFPEADKNTVSWALVELQNENCMRGKNRPKTGPMVKTNTGYRLRA